MSVRRANGRPAGHLTIGRPMPETTATPRIFTVCGTTNPEKASMFWRSWRDRAYHPHRLHHVTVWNNAPENANPKLLEPHLAMRPGDVLLTDEDYVGSTGALVIALKALKNDLRPNDLIAWFHDDLEILQDAWDVAVYNLWALRPSTILAGFFGARELAHANIYKVPYSPHQLARGDCWSNMREAEKHGGRRTIDEGVMVCAMLDGFAQIFPVQYGFGFAYTLKQLGIFHHAYDVVLATAARKFYLDLGGKREGNDTVLLPLKCHHAGGMTAVGDRGYNEWAEKNLSTVTHDALEVRGDAAAWHHAHAKAYEYGRGLLPIRIPKDAR